MAATGDSPTGVPWDSSTLHVILATTAIMPLGVRLLSPILPLIAGEFGTTAARTSLLVSGYFLPGIVLSPFLGMVADRVGRRQVLVVGLLVFGVSGGAMGFLDRFVAIVGLRIVQGTAAASLFVVTVTLIADAVEGLVRSTVLGINVSVLFVGGAVYPIVGAAAASGGWNVPFFLYLVGVPVGLFAFLNLEPAGRTTDKWGVEYLRGAVDALPTREALSLYGATVGAEAIFFGAILTVLPFFLASTYGLSSVLIGVIVTAGSAATAATASANGRLAERSSNAGLVALGFVANGAGLLGVRLAPETLSLAAAVVVFGAGTGLILPSVDAAISDVAPPEFRAGAISIRNSTTFLGRTVGPVSFTAIAGIAGYGALLLGAGAFALVVGILAFAAAR